jgi:AAT family amino acid transporter
MVAHTSFQKGLKGRHIQLIALGGIIGSSYFLGTGYIISQVGPSAFLAYALGGLITFLTMACFAELIVAVPKHGSFISYSKTYISPSWAAGVGWSYWISWIVYVPSECIAAGILMSHFAPSVPVYLWSILFGFLITFINLLHVKTFGEMEFWLALIKIFLIIGFSILAILIFFGVIGTTSHEILGDRYLLKQGGLFPQGWTIFFVNMVILLSNFQGSEIIGISASEAENPKTSVPRALKSVTYRIIMLYLIPTFLLVLIFPWKEANLSGSVFAIALDHYGLKSIGHLFHFLIIAAALSCANSGLYATVRALHALALKGMAPKGLKSLNKQGVPVRATLVTLCFMWLLLMTSCFFHVHDLYANLLAISGFTGSICWISICWAQYNFRKKLKNETQRVLTYKTSLFPFSTQLAIWLQVFCLLIVLYSQQLRLSFYLGAPALFIPILIYKYWITKHRKISPP